MGRWIHATAAASLLFLAGAGAHAFDKRDIKGLGSLTIDAAQGDRIPLANVEPVPAGLGWGLRAGLEIPNTEAKTFFTQAFAGYKTSYGPLGHVGEFFTRASPLSNQAYAELHRWTADLMEQYRFAGDFRFGLGATYQFGLRLRCVEIEAGACGSAQTTKPENAWGALAQLSYVISDTFEFGARYTRIDYKTGGQRYDGNTWGVFMVLGFHLFR